VGSLIPARYGVSVAVTDVGVSPRWLAGRVVRREPDVQDAVHALPRAHLLLLRGALVGFSDQELAALVDVPPESVRPLLRIAAAKLGAHLAETDRSA
jgi:DNA-directed RNA polymerase specialized sigma24 family protein